MKVLRVENLSKKWEAAVLILTIVIVQCAFN